MKFVSFSEKGFVRAGVLLGDGSGKDDRVVDLAHPSMRRALRCSGPSMLALIEAGLPSLSLDRPIASLSGGERTRLDDHRGARGEVDHADLRERVAL